MKAINPNGSRVQISSTDSVREILKLVRDPALETIQFMEAIPLSTLLILNNEFFPLRPDVQLRAYGFYSATCDLSFCSRLTNVERFSADCLRDAIGIDHIAEMPRLQSLSLGVWNNESFDLLAHVNPGLTELGLSPTRSRKPDLAYLARFKALKKLYLDTQQKNVEAISTLTGLEEATPRSITLPSLAPLCDLSKLWSLELKLGGTRDLSALVDMKQIKYFELWQVLGLRDIEVISELLGLQHLALQSLLHITTLPVLHRLENLRRVSLDTMKNLKDISALEFAPNLLEVIHIDAKVPPEAYLPLLKKGTLHAAHAGFGSLKKNETFRKLCSSYNVHTGLMSAFVAQ